MCQDLLKDSDLGCKLWPLWELGLNTQVGDDSRLTLDFDWKHVIKRVSTLVQSAKGMVTHGHKVLVGLIAWYLCQAGKTGFQIAALLKPHNLQNILNALKLVQALEEVGNTTHSEDTIVDQANRNAVRGFVDLFGVFVEAFTDSSKSLSEQLTLLSKCAHLSAYYYCWDGLQFMTNQLYFNSMTCIKNAFFFVAKQQLLDEDIPFILFQLGSNALEKVFAGTQMTGSHNSNFTLKELVQQLAHRMDIMRVYGNHPEWYLAYQCMSTTRRGKAGCLSPQVWEGDAIAGHVNLLDVWKRGSVAATKSIKCLTEGNKVITDWKRFWAKLLKSDMLQPCGYDKYPAVKGNLEVEDPEDAHDYWQMLPAASKSQGLAPVFDNLPKTECNTTIATVIADCQMHAEALQPAEVLSASSTAPQLQLHTGGELEGVPKHKEENGKSTWLVTITDTLAK